MSLKFSRAFCVESYNNNEEEEDDDNYYSELQDGYKKSIESILSKHNKLVDEYNMLEHTSQTNDYKLSLLEKRYDEYLKGKYWDVYDNIFDRPEFKDKLNYSFTIDELTYDEFCIVVMEENVVLNSGYKPKYGTGYGVYTDAVMVSRYCEENVKAHKALDGKKIFKPHYDNYVWSRTLELLIFPNIRVYVNITRYDDRDTIIIDNCKVEGEK